MPTHYSFKVSEDTASIDREYDRLKSLPPGKPVPAPAAKPPKIDAALLREVQAMLAALDDKGRWVKSAGLTYHRPKDPTARVIRCETFIRNIGSLTRYLTATRD